MRKGYLGKALAVTMASAVAITSFTIPGGIQDSNPLAVVKQVKAENEDAYTYCYVGLKWDEFWANEGVYNATDSTSSDELDWKEEADKGGYDAVTRATTNHGLHRGSFQCMTTIYTTDGKEYKVSNWTTTKNESGTDVVKLILTDKTEVEFSKGVITDSAGTHTMKEYKVLGTKYVPVKVLTSDLDALKEKYQVVENGGTLVGGYTETSLKAYSKTANVTENTNGLKTAIKDGDKFTFTARQTGTESGIQDEALKTVEVSATDRTKLNVEVKAASGSYGEFLRVDLTGSQYGDLGSNMQSVKWTYYGADDTNSDDNIKATYGTKFAADNWMHKSMGIQLGLTDSVRCQLPDGTDGTGNWTITVSALGYKDVVIPIEVTSKNIVTEVAEGDLSELKTLIATAETIKNDGYTTKSWTDFQTELDESKGIVEMAHPLASVVEEQIGHLTEAMKALEKEPTTATTATTTTTTTVTPTTTTTATTTTVTTKLSKVTIAKISAIKKNQFKVNWKKQSGVTGYQVQYSTSKKFKNAKTVKATAKATSKVLKKLKKNKKYYVRVRSYKVTKTNGKNKTTYGTYSAIKSAKTKKK